MTGETFFYHYAFKKTALNHLTLLYRREEALKVGFYELDYLFSDMVSFAKLICGKELAYLNEVVGAWRSHDNNVSKTLCTKNLKKMLEAQLEIIKIYQGRSFNGVSHRNWAHRFLNGRIYAQFSSLIKTKKIFSASYFFIKFIGFNPKLLPDFTKLMFSNLRSYLGSRDILRRKTA